MSVKSSISLTFFLVFSFFYICAEYSTQKIPFYVNLLTKSQKIKIFVSIEGDPRIGKYLRLGLICISSCSGHSQIHRRPCAKADSATKRTASNFFNWRQSLLSVRIFLMRPRTFSWLPKSLKEVDPDPSPTFPRLLL